MRSYSNYEQHILYKKFATPSSLTKTFYFLRGVFLLRGGVMVLRASINDYPTIGDNLFPTFDKDVINF